MRPTQCEKFAILVQEAREHEAEDDAFREEQRFDRTHAPGSPLGADGDLDVLPEAAAGRPEEVRICLALQLQSPLAP